MRLFKRKKNKRAKPARHRRESEVGVVYYIEGIIDGILIFFYID